MLIQVDTEDLITQSKAAEMRKCTRQAIASLVLKKRLSTVSIGGVVFVSKKEVENFTRLSCGRKPG